MEGILDLDALRRRIESFEAQSGSTASSYLVTRVPRAGVHGEVAGRPIEDTFAPRVALRMDDLRLVVDASEAGHSFTSDRDGAIDTLRPNTIGVHGHALRVSVARALALFGVALALIAALALWLLGGRPGGRNQAAGGARPQRLRPRGGGNDSLNGGAGTDVCIGGPGTDTFNANCETRIQ